MTQAKAFNEEQRTRWREVEGGYWVREQENLDRMLAPMMGPLLALAAPVQGSTAIDVGCGCGATTIELAKAVGPLGKVVALDVSDPMLARAAERLKEFANTSCLLGDAAETPLRGLEAELIVSRLGVMFFGDPVAAFANLRSGLAPGGRLRFVCWRTLKENPWLHVPLQAVYEHAPRPPKPAPEEPGAFSFADPERVTRILTEAGFDAPTFTPLDVEIDLAQGRTFEQAVIQATELGPARRALADQPEEIRAAAIESIRRALAPFTSAAGVKLGAAAWLVAATSFQR